MKNLINYSFIILTLACTDVSKKQQAFENLCSKEKKFDALIGEVVNIPEFQDYLRVQQTLKQRELVIIKNDIILKPIDIHKFDLPVRFLTAEQISEKKIKAFIEIKQIDISSDSAKVYFKYDVQGVGSICKFVTTNDCGWKVVSVQLWEN